MATEGSFVLAAFALVLADFFRLLCALEVRPSVRLSLSVSTPIERDRTARCELQFFHDITLRVDRVTFIAGQDPARQKTTDVQHHQKRQCVFDDTEREPTQIQTA